jgi:hypothetical protein
VLGVHQQDLLLEAVPEVIQGHHLQEEAADQCVLLADQEVQAEAPPPEADAVNFIKLN